MDWEDRAEGKLCLATLLKLQLSLARSGEQYDTFDLTKSFFSVYMSYYLELLGVLMNWSLSNPAVSDVLDGYPSAMVRFNFSSFLQTIYLPVT